jgi:hypothetical protein
MEGSPQNYPSYGLGAQESNSGPAPSSYTVKMAEYRTEAQLF